MEKKAIKMKQNGEKMAIRMAKKMAIKWRKNGDKMAKKLRKN